MSISQEASTYNKDNRRKTVINDDVPIEVVFLRIMKMVFLMFYQSTITQWRNFFDKKTNNRKCFTSWVTKSEITYKIIMRKPNLPKMCLSIISNKLKVLWINAKNNKTEKYEKIENVCLIVSLSWIWEDKSSCNTRVCFRWNAYCNIVFARKQKVFENADYFIILLFI